jgi:hypothetical protein
MVKDIRFDRSYSVRRTNERDKIYMYRTQTDAEVETAFIDGGYKQPSPVSLTRKHLANTIQHEKTHDILLRQGGKNLSYDFDDPDISAFVDQGRRQGELTDFRKYIRHLNYLRRYDMLEPNQYVAILRRLRDEHDISPQVYSDLIKDAINDSLI